MIKTENRWSIRLNSQKTGVQIINLGQVRLLVRWKNILHFFKEKNGKEKRNKGEKDF